MIFVATKKVGQLTPPPPPPPPQLLLLLDPEWMKIRIWEKHPESATLVSASIGLSLTLFYSSGLGIVV